MTKARSKSIRDQLRVIEDFLRTWDPIRVIASPDGRLDEYDTYAPQILGKLQAGVDANALAQHLHELATREMGVCGDVARELNLAQALLAWWVSEHDENTTSRGTP